MKGSASIELIVKWGLVGDSICAKDKYISSCRNASSVHNLMLNTVAKGYIAKTQEAEMSISSASADRRVGCSSKQSSFCVICQGVDD